MEKFIPYEKLSKKKQRELNAARRGTWTINPVTRKPANPKAYNRKTARNWKDDSNSVPFDSVFGSDVNGETEKPLCNPYNSFISIYAVFKWKPAGMRACRKTILAIL